MRQTILLLALGAASALPFMAAKQVAAGDKVPSVELDLGFPPSKVDLAAHVAGKKVILMGLPGAFTPTWSSVQIPGYLAAQGALKDRGIDEVMVFCVNDGAVMTAWSKDQGADDSLLTFYGDPAGKLTKALGVLLDHPGPSGKGLLMRSKRFAAYVVDGVVKAVEVSEKPDDPAGDDFPESSCVENMLTHIDALAKSEL